MKIHQKTVRVRLAPSPTGSFHIGTARTALFNWLFARQNGGAFIVRIEDTDMERSEKKFEAEILEGLRWLGLDWDEGPRLDADKRGLTTQINADNIGENPRLDPHTSAYIGDYGPYRQSERKDIYKKYIEKLLSDGYAYYCYCTKEELEAERQTMLSQGLPSKYGGHCRNITSPQANKKPEVIRFKTPEATAEFKDIIRGKITFNASLLGDMVIAKDSSNPLYNLANVIDDELMEITHVIRGEDHLSNTQKQILFVRALGFNEVMYAHLPLILNPDRSKMSKRAGDTALLEYRNRGYLPEAIVNFLALLGWHSKDNREVFERNDLIKEFDLARVQKGGAMFNQEKLDWLQGEHLKKTGTEEIFEKLTAIFKEKNIAAESELLKRVIEIERTRIKNLREFTEEVGFFFILPEYDPKLLVWQKQQMPGRDIGRILAQVAETLEVLKLKGDYPSREEISYALGGLIAADGRGGVLWPLRVALSGQTASPDPAEIIEILGITESKKRIKIAIKKTEKL